MAESTTQGKAQGAIRQLFIDVLAQANIPDDFFKEILSKKRILSFRTAMSLDDDQYEDLRALVEKSKDEGFKMDFLQFRKLMNAGKYFIINNYEKKVPWETFDTDMTLDLIDEYLEFKSNKDRNDLLQQDAANLQKSEQQVIGIGLDIVRRTGDFEKGLIGWLARPAVGHTWPNFKQHFNAAYRELKRIRGLAMRSTAFHQAHQVAADLTKNFHQMRDDVIAAMNSLTIHQADPQENTSPSATSTINAATSTNTQLMTAIQKLHQQLQSMSTTLTNGSNGNGSRQRRRNVSKYYWSHGACTHASRDCKKKKPGHKDDATFDDKMGGSTYYCSN